MFFKNYEKKLIILKGHIWITGLRAHQLADQLSGCESDLQSCTSEIDQDATHEIFNLRICRCEFKVAG
jgi:hypothetical protein